MGHLARALMGLMKDRHGTWYARVKIPERLQAAVARVLDRGKERQSFLKKSLGTKDLKTANVRAKPVLAGFDRTLSAATALPEPAPAASLGKASMRPRLCASQNMCSPNSSRSMSGFDLAGGKSGNGLRLKFADKWTKGRRCRPRRSLTRRCPLTVSPWLNWTCAANTMQRT